MPTVASLNGALVPLAEARVPVLDRGFMFGDGAYEVVRVYAGRPFLLGEHLARLGASLAALRIGGAGGARPEDEARRVLDAAALSEGTLYLQVTRGAPGARTHAPPVAGSAPAPDVAAAETNPFEDAFPPASVPPTVFLYAMPLEDARGAERAAGCAAITFADLRWARCDIKSVNLLGNVFAAQAAREAGVYEAILVRPDGTVSEGSHTNVLAVTGDTLRTMPTGPAILAGITRAQVLALARARGLAVDERALSVDELRAAREVMLTGTTTEVMPVVTLDGRPVGDGRPGPVTRALAADYAALVAAATRG